MVAATTHHKLETGEVGGPSPSMGKEGTALYNLKRTMRPMDKRRQTRLMDGEEKRRQAEAVAKDAWRNGGIPGKAVGVAVAGIGIYCSRGG